MKNIRYILISIACIFTAAACSLDEESFTEIEKDKYINDASEANTVLLGIYKNMTYDEMYGYYLSIYFTLPSDIAKITGNELTNWRNVPCNAFTSTEDEIQGAWEYLYNSIYQANDFIEGLAAKMEEFSDNDKKTATAYMGEARALRALFYFELVRWYGHVPLMTKTSQSDQHPSTFVQADPVDVYKFIEQDLLYAIEVLPYATDDTVRSDNSFRISKGGALGLLAKVYATWAGYPLYDETKWEDAAKTAEILVTSGKHGLLSDYEQLWKNSANSGFANVQFITDSIADITDEVQQPSEKNVYNVLDLLGQLMSYYELYFEGEIDIKTKTLIFTVRKSKETTVKIKLEDYGITSFGKSYPETNMVIASTADYSTTKKWFLLQSGEITDKEELQDIFPTTAKIITKDTIDEANTEAILELAENRNQENIEITVTQNDRNYNIDFNTSVVVYYEGKLYKTLPIGEISESEDMEKEITLGYKPVELIQLI